ncbi:MAG: DUF4860 domain-containing protein [Oscillospiraceae bacterium]|nr:DUF4860 domain-containing protein [Oscillospiraceae bacterium]
MNKLGSRQLTDTVSSAGSMVLFLIFTVCCLIIITVAASAYGRISENYEDTFNSAAAVRYVTNKLRSCEGAEVLPDGDIVLYFSGYKTIIYERDGMLYERLFPAGAEVSPEGGEAVFRAENYSAMLFGSDMISVSASGNSGDIFTAYCHIPDIGGLDQ